MWLHIFAPITLGVTFHAAGFAYDYSKFGQDWVQGMCASRERQSPINFDDLTSPPTGRLSFSYQLVSSSFEFSNNGHTYAASFAGLGYGGITYENGWYNLMNVNVHSPSEHTFQGNHYPLELHMVHKKYDSDALLIVAIPVAGPDASAPAPAPVAGGPVQPFQFFQKQAPSAPAPAPAPAPSGAPGPAGPKLYIPPDPKDPGFNPQLQHFLKLAPPVINQKNTLLMDEADPLDLNSFMTGGTFFEYGGSLTSPPCAEIATWFVRRSPIIASKAQIDVLHNAVYQMTADFGNARSPMPINDRPIAVRSAAKEEPPPQAPELSVPLGPNPRTDREFRAMKWAKDALKIAKTATDYVKDMDFRLRSAAEAHANALAPDRPQHLAPAAAPPPGTPMAAHMDIQATADSMAASIAGAAQEAIAAASTKITEEAKNAAMKAATSQQSQAQSAVAPLSPAAAPPGGRALPIAFL